MAPVGATTMHRNNIKNTMKKALTIYYCIKRRGNYNKAPQPKMEGGSGEYRSDPWTWAVLGCGLLILAVLQQKKGSDGNNITTIVACPAARWIEKGKKKGVHIFQSTRARAFEWGPKGIFSLQKHCSYQLISFFFSHKETKKKKDGHKRWIQSIYIKMIGTRLSARRKGHLKRRWIGRLFGVRTTMNSDAASSQGDIDTAHTQIQTAALRLELKSLYIV